MAFNCVTADFRIKIERIWKAKCKSSKTLTMFIIRLTVCIFMNSILINKPCLYHDIELHVKEGFASYRACIENPHASQAERLRAVLYTQ